jgi:DNA-binding beta-propeller fold protein YncE
MLHAGSGIGSNSQGDGRLLAGKGANWVTISPDDKTAYVANPQTNDVSVVDIKSLKEV